MTKLTDLCVHELECELLKAHHEARIATNNARAFHLRTNIATTQDAKLDAEGCARYWERMAANAGCYVRDIERAISINSAC